MTRRSRRFETTRYKPRKGQGGMTPDDVLALVRRRASTLAPDKRVTVRGQGGHIKYPGRRAAYWSTFAIRAADLRSMNDDTLRGFLGLSGSPVAQLWINKERV